MFRRFFAISRPGPLTQSEHDWSCAKRALARGDDPEEIVGPDCGPSRPWQARSSLLRALDGWQSPSGIKGERRDNSKHMG